MGVALKEWTGRLAALALLTGLLVVGYRLIVSPIARMHASAHERLERLERQEASYARLVEERAAWEERKRSILDNISQSPLLIAASDPSQAHATTLTAASDLAAASGLAVLSTETRRQDNNGGLVHYPITLRLSGSDRAIVRFLAALEQARPILLLDHLSLRMTDGSVSPEGDPILSAEIDLVAFGRVSP